MALPSAENLGDKMKGLFGGMFESSAEFDKTRKALESLRKGVEANIDPTALLQKIREAFDKDLDDLDIKDPAERDGYWQKIETKIQGYLRAAQERTLLKSPEFKDLQAFTGNLENLTGLEEIIKDKDPKAKATAWLAGVPFAGAIAEYLIGWADDVKKENKNTDNWMSRALKKFAGYFDPEIGKPTGVAGEAETPEAVATNPKTPEVIPATLAGAHEFLNAHGLKATDKPVQDDWKNILTTLGITAEKADEFAREAAKNTSALQRIYNAATGKLNGNAFAARVFDIRLNSLAGDKTPQVVDAITATATPTPDRIRKFLDAIQPNDPTTIAKAQSEHLTA